MTERNKDQASRIKIEDLSEAETELTADEAKRVKGGLTGEDPNPCRGCWNVKAKEGDGSVKPRDAVSNQLTIKQKP